MIARLRWLYLLYYAGIGTFLSYFAPYLRGLGFSGEQIGTVTFAQQAVAAPAALIWGGIATAWRPGSCAVGLHGRDAVCALRPALRADAVQAGSCWSSPRRSPARWSRCWMPPPSKR